MMLSPQDVEARGAARRRSAVLFVCVLSVSSLTPTAEQPEPPVKPPKPAFFAVTATNGGKVFLLEREKLTTARAVTPAKPGPAAAPMLVAEDAPAGSCLDIFAAMLDEARNLNGSPPSG